MPKKRLTLKVRLPPYRSPRIAWRHDLHEAVQTAAAQARVAYAPSDNLELKVVLYLKGDALFVHDVDNRLKDIMDALQGRAGGKKGKSTLTPIIPNDRQIFKVTVEKMPPFPQSLGLGHLTVRKYGRATCLLKARST